MLDITDTAKVLEKVSGGVDEKLWVELAGNRYLLKREDILNRYCAYNEYVCSRVFEWLQISCMDVELVTFQNKVWACCSDLGEVVNYDVLNKELFDTEKPLRPYTMENILCNISYLRGLSVEQKFTLMDFFKRLFVVDAWTGNIDRNRFNWGWRSSGEVYPVFDNGCAFCSNVLYERRKCSVVELLHRLVIEQPESSVRFKGVSRGDYRTILQETNVVSEELNWLKSCDYKNIINYAIEGLNDSLRRFYHYLLHMRFRCVIEGEEFEVALKEVKELPYVFPGNVEEFLFMR